MIFGGSALAGMALGSKQASISAGALPPMITEPTSVAIESYGSGVLVAGYASDVALSMTSGGTSGNPSGGTGGNTGGGGDDGGGGGTTGDLATIHTGTGSFFMVDTSNGVWAPFGPFPTDGTVTIKIDGNELADIYDLNATGAPQQPSSAHPKQAYMVPVGRHTFELSVTGSATKLTASADCYWRGWPWKGKSDVYGGTGGNNPLYFGGEMPTYPTAGPPSDINEFLDGVPFSNIQVLNNGYSINLDPGPSQAAVFIVAPGDQGYPVGGGTTDTRAEFNWTESYNTGAIKVPGQPKYPNTAVAGWGFGTDVLGNNFLSYRVYRIDFAYPQAYQAPVTVQNASIPNVADPTAWSRDLATRTQKVNGVNVPLHPWPSAPGDVASKVVTQTKASLATNSNIVENQGPAVFLWGRGQAGGAPNNGAFQFAWQPVTGGLGLKTYSWDLVNIVYGTAYPTIVEYQMGFYSTGAGVPFFLNAAPAYSAPYTTVGTQMALQSANKFPFCPVGMPRTATGAPNTPFGGSFIRTWRYFSGKWNCTSQNLLDPSGNAVSVPGAVTLDSNFNVIVDETQPQFGFGLDAGKVFGPTMKANKATLVAQIAANYTGAISLTGAVAPTGFASAGGYALIDTELIHFNAYAGGNMSGITRAVLGTQAAVHNASAVVHGIIVPVTLTPGMNASQPPSPMAARIWPLMLSSEFATMASIDPATYNV